MQQQNRTFCDIAKTFHSYTHTYVFVQLHPFRWPSPYTMYGLSLFTFICSSNTRNTHPIYETGFQIHFRILYTFCTEIKREKLERFFNDDDDGGGYLEPGELINFVLHFAFDIHNIAPVSGGCASISMRILTTCRQRANYVRCFNEFSFAIFTCTSKHVRWLCDALVCFRQCW